MAGQLATIHARTSPVLAGPATRRQGADTAAVAPRSRQESRGDRHRDRTATVSGALFPRHDGRVTLLLMADTHVPHRARDLPEQLWRAVAEADVVVHAGDWVCVELLNPGSPTSAANRPAAG